MAGSSVAVEIRHLRYLVAAAELGSFRKAAEHFGVRPSTVSRRIGEFEYSIGTPLFSRHEGGVVLTDAGRHYLRRAKRVLIEIMEATHETAKVKLSSRSVLRIGVTSSGCSTRLLKLIRAFERGGLERSVEIIEGSEIAHGEALQRHELDVAYVIGRQKWPCCNVTRFERLPLMVAIPSGHALLQKRRIEWSDLKSIRLIAGSSFVDSEIEKLANRNWRGMSISHKVNHHEVSRANLLNLVALGHGLALLTLPNEPLPLGLELRPLSDTTVSTAFLWHASNKSTEVHRFLGMILGLPIVGAYGGQSLPPHGVLNPAINR